MINNFDHDCSGDLFFHPAGIYLASFTLRTDIVYHERVHQSAELRSVVRDAEGNLRLHLLSRMEADQIHTGIPLGIIPESAYTRAGTQVTDQVSRRIKLRGELLVSFHGGTASAHAGALESLMKGCFRRFPWLGAPLPVDGYTLRLMPLKTMNCEAAKAAVGRMQKADELFRMLSGMPHTLPSRLPAKADVTFSELILSLLSFSKR